MELVTMVTKQEAYIWMGLGLLRLFRIELSKIKVLFQAFY